MKISILSSLLTTLALMGCSQTSQPTIQEPSPNPLCTTKSMPGGWSDADITPDVQAAVNALMSHMGSHSELQSVDKVRTQVVSGINYAIEYRLKNGEVWHAVVYRNLRNDYMVDQVATPGPLCP
ncbi:MULTISPECIES: cystatin domain-containing protein [Vibrio]|uniref:cystatin domain-containing protein n=1 Tax=Vibrio TaxID=662 RepID=UPI00056FB622|nr:cystatin domain-containing protein [Vibrio pacinii]